MKTLSRRLEREAPQRRTLAADLLAEGKFNDALCALSHVYEQDGDVMQCRCCSQGIHVYYAGQPLRHGLAEATGNDCPYQGDKNPWDILLEAAIGRRAQHSLPLAA
ncbi:hypothetical protein J2847_005805 [Azospirillum agricola]|uniref:hypothetical protein n=1 Tax=Azospirillum agricola TaxID=1720247 RepID=UPI001AE4A0D9|nr:hypothetical protein [Azospirillum agricola]MBP2232476.1 hypothetical protein [Azospirillum agricola]